MVVCGRPVVARLSLAARRRAGGLAGRAGRRCRLQADAQCRRQGQARLSGFPGIHVLCPRCSSEVSAGCAAADLIASLIDGMILPLVAPAWQVARESWSMRMAVRRLKNYIGGQWVDAPECEWLDVRNPSTDEVIAEVPLSPASEIDRAVAAAAEAYPAWSAMPVAKRCAIIFQITALLREHSETIARTLVEEIEKIADWFFQRSLKPARTSLIMSQTGLDEDDIRLLEEHGVLVPDDVTRSPETRRYTLSPLLMFLRPGEE